MTSPNAPWPSADAPDDKEHRHVLIVLDFPSLNNQEYHEALRNIGDAAHEVADDSERRPRRLMWVAINQDRERVLDAIRATEDTDEPQETDMSHQDDEIEIRCVRTDAGFHGVLRSKGNHKRTWTTEVLEDEESVIHAISLLPGVALGPEVNEGGVMHRTATFEDRGYNKHVPIDMIDERENPDHEDDD